MDVYREISLRELFICIWEKIWIILLVTAMCGIGALLITKFLIVPQYKATISLYVNNRTDSTNTVSTGDVAASKSLVDTYITIIESNSVVNDIVANAGFDVTAKQIKKMISAASINGTEVFEVSITGTSPQKCAKIANLIAELAPSKISEIVSGSSVKIIDNAKDPTEPISPSVPKNIAIACLLGFLISSLVVVLIHMFDNAIYNEDDIKEFCALPVLGIFSDFDQESHGSYNYEHNYAGRSKEL